MFTGLVESIGVVGRLELARGGGRLVVREPSIAAEVSPGESVAVSGACLTVAEVKPPDFAFDVVAETLSRTTLGDLRASGRVNLERALRLGDRLGGHLVQGHVDGTAVAESVEPEGGGLRVRFRLARDLASGVVDKGSIAVDGVSLTVAGVGAERFEVALVPTTLAETTLGAIEPGRRVNVETDLIGKYVARLLGRPGGGAGGVSLETLRREGFA